MTKTTYFCDSCSMEIELATIEHLTVDMRMLMLCKPCENKLTVKEIRAHVRKLQPDR